MSSSVFMSHHNSITAPYEETETHDKHYHPSHPSTSFHPIQSTTSG